MVHVLASTESRKLAFPLVRIFTTSLSKCVVGKQEADYIQFGSTLIWPWFLTKHRETLLRLATRDFARRRQSADSCVHDIPYGARDTLPGEEITCRATLRSQPTKLPLRREVFNSRRWSELPFKRRPRAAHEQALMKSKAKGWQLCNAVKPLAYLPGEKWNGSRIKCV